MVQLTLTRLQNYRSWTHTLGEDREHKLQAYQANFYKIIQEIFSKRGGIVFPSKYDEFFAITSGISIEEHRKIQYALSLSFPVDSIMFVSSDESPMKVNENISKMIKTSQLDFSKRVFGIAQENQDPIHIIHADIEGQTKIAKEITPFEMSNLILKIQQKISQFFIERNSLTFYMGGDNFIMISDRNAKQYAQELVEYVDKNFGLSINCGIGKAEFARKAMMLATTALDSIRQYRAIGKERINIIETEHRSEKFKIAYLHHKTKK